MRANSPIAWEQSRSPGDRAVVVSDPAATSARDVEAFNEIGRSGSTSAKGV